MTNKNCILCNSDEITKLGLYFKHYNHVLCDECLLESLYICICKRKIEDTTNVDRIIVKCPCKDKPINIYFEITTEILLEILQKGDKNMKKEVIEDKKRKYMLECCGGCDIEDYSKMISKHKCAIEMVVFDIDGEYHGDVINEEFMELAKKLDYDIF